MQFIAKLKYVLFLDYYPINNWILYLHGKHLGQRSGISQEPPGRQVKFHWTKSLSCSKNKESFIHLYPTVLWKSTGVSFHKDINPDDTGG